jgi:hypothetical protein
MESSTQLLDAGAATGLCLERRRPRRDRSAEQERQRRRVMQPPAPVEPRRAKGRPRVMAHRPARQQRGADVVAARRLHQLQRT